MSTMLAQIYCPITEDLANYSSVLLHTVSMHQTKQKLQRYESKRF